MKEHEQIANLKQWLLDKDAEKIAYECFWKSFNNYKIEEPQEFYDVFGEFESNKLEISINSVAITFLNYPDLNYNHVVLNLPFRYNNKEIGNYRLLLNFDGTLDDDFFIIDSA